MDNNQNVLAHCEKVAQEWLSSSSYDAETQKAVKAMLENPDKTELIDSFYRTLEFGTGGLRGIMGAGTNRMNIYTVGMATQGFSNYLKKNFANRESISVVVCHDCRNNSQNTLVHIGLYIQFNISIDNRLGHTSVPNAITRLTSSA